jgi:DNA replication licensing factor MCM7
MATNVGVLPVAGIQIDYTEELEKISTFLSTFVPPPRARRDLPADDDEEAEEDLADEINDLDVDDNDEREERSKAKYMKVLRRVANRQTAEVVIDLADLRKVSRLVVEVADDSSRTIHRCCTIF